MIIGKGRQPEEDTSLLACFSRLVNYKDNSPLPRDTLAANVGIFFVAGYETTAHAITWALFELAADQSLQVRFLGTATTAVACTDLRCYTVSCVDHSLLCCCSCSKHASCDVWAAVYGLCNYLDDNDHTFESCFAARAGEGEEGARRGGAGTHPRPSPP